jgi:hypothetical protein
MRKVVCNFSLFDMEQTVYIHTEENGAESYQQIGKCSLEDLGKIVTNVCFSENIDTVHLYGHNKYIEGILQDIDFHSGCSAYSNGMIKVEVN